MNKKAKKFLKQSIHTRKQSSRETPLSTNTARRLSKGESSKENTIQKEYRSNCSNSRLSGNDSIDSQYSSLEEFQEMELASGLVRVMPKMDYDISNLFLNQESGPENECIFDEKYRYNKHLQRRVKIHPVFKVPIIQRESKYEFFSKRDEFSRCNIKIKQSIHELNDVSPFKDAHKTKAPNFILEEKHEEEKVGSQNFPRAKPPMLKKPLAVISQKVHQESQIKLEDNIAILENGHEKSQNTSFDSMGTDQIFMTYAENDTNGEEEQEKLQSNHILIDQEIDKIKENMRMPTTETEEDELLFKDDENINQNLPFEYQVKADEFSCEKANNLFSPLVRKIALMEYDFQADISEAKHLNSTSGFLLAPDLAFKKVHDKKKGGYMYEASAIIDHKSPEMILHKLMNASILKSFLCTPIKLLSCGLEHCAVLTSFGTVATWGYGASGCLGHGNYTSFTSPKLVQVKDEEYLNEIDTIECGGYHTICISNSHSVYSWGRGDVGQLGHYKGQLAKDKMGLVQLTPKLIEYFQEVPIIQAGCGEAHTLLLDKWGRIFSFGWHQLGQLGVGKVNDGFSINYIKGIPKISKIFSGAIFSMAISSHGKVYTWGCGESGQLGLGVEIKESVIPIQIGVGTEFEQKNVIEGICGSSHSIVMTDEGEIYAWGQGEIKSKSDSKELKYIKASNVGTVLTHVETIHKFLLKKKTPKVSKPLRYYSQRCSPEKIVEISTISSPKDSDDSGKLEKSALQKASLLRNNLPSSRVPFKKKPFQEENNQTKKLFSYKSQNSLSARDKLSKIQNTYIKTHAKNSPSLGSRESASRSPIIKNAKTRPPSSRTGKNALNGHSRSEMYSINSNSPRKFLQIQSDHSLLDSSAHGHRYKNSVLTSTHKANHSTLKSDLSPRKNRNMANHTKEESKDHKQCKFSLLKSRVNSALNQFKERKSPSSRYQRSPGSSTAKIKIGIKPKEKGNKRRSARAEPYTTTSKISKTTMLNEMSKQMLKPKKRA
ncbi:unnamed protein product [Moneuplotes crassus]|uniref:RCC1-like domain-containing protein n=1 Tax=Euplotes crassus TaxID=5936 RepID=A0AAD1XQV3_EUPCR|nr:unnamed protein product [Moneuplotes crassus]